MSQPLGKENYKCFFSSVHQILWAVSPNRR
jgi:hypothetical protein